VCQPKAPDGSCVPPTSSETLQDCPRFWHHTSVHVQAVPHPPFAVSVHKCCVISRMELNDSCHKVKHSTLIPIAMKPWIETGMSVYRLYNHVGMHALTKNRTCLYCGFNKPHKSWRDVFVISISYGKKSQCLASVLQSIGHTLRTNGQCSHLKPQTSRIRTVLQFSFTSEQNVIGP
jgi:hypothetical protein